MKKKIIIIVFLCFLKQVFPQAGFYQQYSGTGNNLNFIQGYVYGNNGTILYTTDGGRNWQSQNSGISININSGFLFSNIGIAVGNQGTIIRKQSSGYNWVIMNSGVTNDLKDVVVINSSTALIVGTNGLILKTITGGLNWFSVPSGVTSNLNRIVRITITNNVSYYLIAGNNGVLLLSTDNGTNWNPKTSGTSANLNGGISFNYNNTYTYAVGNNGTLLFSSNSGESWIPKPTGFSQNFNSISYASQWGGLMPSYLWIGGQNGMIILSNDYGNSWIQQQSNTTQNINSIIADFGNSAYAVCNGGLILHSSLASSYYSSKIIDANQIKTWFDNTGYVNTHISYVNNNSYADGFEWPKGSGKQAIFGSYLWLAGKVQNELRGSISHSLLDNEFYPGYIDYLLQAPHGKSDTTFRLYKVSPQFPNGGNGYDSWSLWPVSQGAQWVDNNHNGIYEPPVDNPLMKGDQNIFCAFTDGYPESHTCFAGFTKPLNAEVHLYCFAVNNPQCADAVYMEWKIINKKNIPWDSFHVGLWSDPDLGQPTNDKTGCDTTLNLGYNYNGTPDYTYNINPPAFGYALYKVSRHTDKLMDIFNDPRKDVYEPNNVGESFNLLKGLKKDGTPWINPFTNQPSKMLYTGNPETDSGWIPSYIGDTRMLMVSYIGTVQPLDTIDFYAVAVIKAGDNIFNAVTKLKDCIHKGVIGIDNSNNKNILPFIFKLYQNYPNPFNPISNIKYQIPSNVKGEMLNVKLVIYDILGKEIAILVNQHQKPGTYNIDFDGTNYASGLYFYELSAGDYRETRKMVLIK